ncbi:pimeloyl-ACP methyl esterase BioG family protein [Aestuariibius sp. HNIBRBA575]|uniref:pimeloyl-ACP methyl esterase BioG family protein n=1 Tax=Aestuariibius sp. HNIBRBA575 TaxID=3233343 RepID=UPI0034A2576C
MKHHWLSRSDSADVLVVFGGWALGEDAFNSLICDGDVLLVEDYTQLDNPLEMLAHYDRVDMLGFSFGVASMVHWLAQSGVQPARLIAVAGTLSPADEQHGIAPDLIRATADQLTEHSFAKFCRRAGLVTRPPVIDIHAAQAELHAVIRRGPAPNLHFDRIWIPQQDRIIPTRAQETAWKPQQHVVQRLQAPHIPFQAGQNWADWIV